MKRVYNFVCMPSTVFWDITLCSPLKVNRRFGGTHRLHLQGRRISRARNQHENRWQAEITRCHIPEDSNNRNHPSENLKSYIACVQFNADIMLFMKSAGEVGTSGNASHSCSEVLCSNLNQDILTRFFAILHSPSTQISR
jgi:hypothetical protein